MTKKLNELFDLPDNQEIINNEASEKEKTKKLYSKVVEKENEIETQLTEIDKISAALPKVTGLGTQSDKELNEIAEKAMDSYTDLMSLGMNAEIRYSGRIFEVAGSMLKTSLEAKTAKIDKKLKMLDLQIKKQKLDQDEDNNQNETNTLTGEVFTGDRNAFIESLRNAEKDK